MFAEAIQNASQFTFPYVGLRLLDDGTVNCVVASFVVVNAEGWIVTSAHVIEEIIASGGMKVDDGPQPDKMPGLARSSEIWALPGFDSLRPRIVTGHVNKRADIAIGRLEPFDGARVAEYPVLRDTSFDPVRQGESVCRLGFPFHGFSADFDNDTGVFRLDASSFPAPQFALDGIVARFNKRMSNGGFGLFIETSTPGLKGQSGGPLLDKSGRVTGIQSHTAHYDLGFDARYERSDGETIVERQFLNVGYATHVDEVIRMLDGNGVTFVAG